MSTTLPLISVLMPVYNVKQYISSAIDSILNQTYTNFELIIINDGSTDGSGTIAESYKAKDSRIKVFHIENGGVSNARNVALSYAQGEFVSFVDSDDTVKEEYLESLYNAISKYNADISIGSYYRYVEEEQMCYFPILDEECEDKVLSGLEAYQNYYNPNYAYNISLVIAWGKLIRKELFNEIYFPVGKLLEDSYTIYKLYILTDKIVFVYKHLYMYRIRPDSIMTQKWSKEKILAQIGQHEERLALLTTLGISITESNREDYIASLRNCAAYALEYGYVDEYKMIKQKLYLIDTLKK